MSMHVLCKGKKTNIKNMIKIDTDLILHTVTIPFLIFQKIALFKKILEEKNGRQEAYKE